MLAISRRRWLRGLVAVTAGGSLSPDLPAAPAAKRDPKVQASVEKALEFLVREQRRQGYWEANGGQYRVAMTALAGIAHRCAKARPRRAASTPRTSRAPSTISSTSAQPNGLIGYQHDYHYTYGHGFSMLFLSQVFGEEEDAERRERIKRCSTKAVRVQRAGADAARRLGLCLGQGRQRLRRRLDLHHAGAGAAGLPQRRHRRAEGSRSTRASKYIQECTTPDGGVQYSIRGGGVAPADHRGGRRLRVQRRRVRRVRPRRQDAGVLPSRTSGPAAASTRRSISATGTTRTTTMRR